MKKKNNKKEKFNPIITKIKLNYEQAVLSCSCYNTGWQEGGGGSPYWSGSGTRG